MHMEKKSYILKKLNLWICPVILGSVIAMSLMYIIYRPFTALYTGLFAVQSVLLFALFDFLYKRRRFGGLIYMALLVMVCALSFYIAVKGMYYSDTSIITWFYGNEGSYSYEPFYLNAVYLFGSFFIISVLYYFTQVRYRSLGAMLGILLPFIVYAKRADEIPEILVTIIITAYLAVMVHNRRTDPSKPEKKLGKIKFNVSYVISIAVFVSVTGAVTMLIDKPEYQSKLEQDSTFFDYVRTDATGNGDGDDLTETSSPRYGANSYTGEILFYFDTTGDEDEYFLRRQAYDNFDGDVWSCDEERSDLSDYHYTLENPEYSADDIISDMKTLIDMGVFDIDTVPDIDSFLTLENGSVYDDDYDPIVVCAPLFTIADDISGSKLMTQKNQLLKNLHGELFRINYSSGEKYMQSFEFYEPTDKFYEYAASLDLDKTSYKNALLSVNWTDCNEAFYLYNDYWDALYYYTDHSAVSEEVDALAAEITKDCKNDYEKAKALESYFEDEGFIYDLEYVPDDESIEYFLFESKTGVCSSYATAMTLMARTLGLPARYVEGYAAFERDENGSFVIRDSYAHAFVEVYITGCGWMTFDPTVSGYMQIPEQNNFDVSTFITVLSRLLVVIAVVFAIVFLLLLDRILELILRIRLKFMPYEKRVLKLYGNVIKLLGFSAKSDFSAYTTDMLSEYLKASRGVSLEKLFDSFVRVCFGGYSVSQEEYSLCYGEYKKRYRYLRKASDPNGRKFSLKEGLRRLNKKRKAATPEDRD